MARKAFDFSDIVSEKHQKIFKKIESDNTPNFYYPVTFRNNEINYEILKLALFDKDIDDEANVINVTSLEFRNETAFFLNFVCYNLVNLIIFFGKKPTIVIEPGSDLCKLILDKLFIESEDLQNILLNGQLPALLGGNPKELKTHISQLKGECSQIDDKLGVLNRIAQATRDPKPEPEPLEFL